MQLASGFRPVCAVQMRKRATKPSTPYALVFSCMLNLGVCDPSFSGEVRGLFYEVKSVREALLILSKFHNPGLR